MAPVAPAPFGRPLVDASGHMSRAWAEWWVRHFQALTGDIESGDAANAAALAAHGAAPDPHAGYQKESEKNQANGYPGLDAEGHILHSAQPPILGAKVVHSVDRVIANAVPTVLAWDTESFDTGELHAAGSAELTVPADAAGVYLVQTQVTFAAANQGTRYLQLLKNQLAMTTFHQSPALGNNPTTVAVTLMDRALAGDRYNVQVYQDSGMDLTVLATDSYLELIRQGN